MIDWFLILLAITTFVRGLAAGIICGVGLMTLPMRWQIGLIPYVHFIRAYFKGYGVKVYAGLTILGALLTMVATAGIFFRDEPTIVRGSIVASLIATILGFVGTAGALPAMLELWESSDDDELLLDGLLRRFARWGDFSAAWHTISFAALVVALTFVNR